MTAPQNIEALFSVALQHHQSGHLAEAERAYREILSLDPAHANSLHLLGMLGFQCGHLNPASNLIQQAIFIRPDVPLYHSNLGVVLNSLGKLDEAVQSYQRAIALKPDYIEAHSNIANTLVSQGKFEAAMPHFTRALALNPQNAETHVNVGVLLAEQGKWADAIVHYQRAISLNPHSAEAHSNLGNALQAQNRLDDAVDCYRSSLAIKPDYLTALYNLGNAYQALNELDKANDCYNRALAFQPGFAPALHGKALAQLLEGDFVNGWQNYEIRWQTAGHTPKRTYPQPRWDGAPLTGKLLIWPEQGIGDEIMFAGLLPDVQRAGIFCILECDSRLQPLFARSFPGVRVTSTPSSLESFAAHIPIGSLPALFRNDIADFDATTSPYLKADPNQRQSFRSRYSCGKRLVGLAWHTKNRKTGPSRCIDLSLLAPLFNRTDIFCVSLQYGDHQTLEKNMAAVNASILVDRAVDQFTDIDLFAAQIAALDLVITIDNSTAHLAAALGIPVWLLLPYARDWRWLQQRHDSPWYPGMRLFRQPKIGDWKSVISSVSNALE